MSKGAAFVRIVRGIRIALFGLPRAKSPGCSHVWKQVGAITRSDDTQVGMTLQCEHCGDMKNHWISRI